MRLITVAGMERKVGATHFALSLAAKAAGRGLNCGVIVSAQTFEALNQYFILTALQEGRNEHGGTRRFARIGALSLMSGTLPSDVEGFELLVWDCGTHASGQRCFARGDLSCLVAGGQPWELTYLNALLMTTPYEQLENLVLCLRGIDEEEFLHLKTQTANKVRCVQVRHKPNWADDILREDLVEVLRFTNMQMERTAVLGEKEYKGENSE